MRNNTICFERNLTMKWYQEELLVESDLNPSKFWDTIRKVFPQAQQANTDSQPNKKEKVVQTRFHML